MNKYLYILCFSILVVGCKNSTKVSDYNQPVAEETKKVDSIEVVKNTEFVTDSIQIRHIQVGAESPEEKKKFHTSYPSTQFDFINDAEESFAQAYFEAFKKSAKDLDENALAGIDFGQHFELIENNAQFIAFLIERYTSYGNNYDTKYFTHVYDLESKEQVSFSQLFTDDDKYKKFTALARKKAEARVKQIIADMEDLTGQDRKLLWINTQDMFEEGTKAIDENYHAYAWNEKGELTIYFDKYQIASGDFGNIEIRFLPSEYNNLIDPKYESLFHLKSDKIEDKQHTPDISNTYQPTGDIDCSKEPCVAITFDDGPSVYTNELLDILKDNDVKATFFILGKSAEVQRNTILRTYKEGHQIGNHSWDHKDLKNLSRKNVEHQIYDTNTSVEDITGEAPHLMRPPYGSMNAMVKEVAKMPIILWNLDPLDWKDRDAEIVAERMSKAKKNGIVLAHDIHKTTVNAIPQVIKALKEKGYHLVTVDELFAGQELKNGEKYSYRK